MTARGNGLERQFELYKIFKMAIRAEQRAQHMYENAMSHCDDHDLKGILASFRDDEKRHEQEIKAMYRELKQVFDAEGSAGSAQRGSTRGGVTRKATGK